MVPIYQRLMLTKWSSFILELMTAKLLKVKGIRMGNHVLVRLQSG